MGSAVSSIAHVVSSPGNIIGDVVNGRSVKTQDLINTAGMALGGGAGLAFGAGTAAAIGTDAALGGVAAASLTDKGPQAEQAPDTSPADDFQKKQQNYAKQFSANLPGMKEQMAQNISKASAVQNYAQNSQINQKNSSRGLGYGGLNQGQQAANTNANAQDAAAKISSGNAALDDANNTLDAQAISTGVASQQMNQSMANQIYQQQMAQQQASNSNLLGGAGLGLAAYAAFSDEKLKKDIEPGDDEIEMFMDKLDPKSYSYKEPGKGNGLINQPEGEHVGILAQDLEKTPVGKTIVEVDDDGNKMIHAGKALGPVLAALSQLNKKVKGLEINKGDS